MSSAEVPHDSGSILQGWLHRLRWGYLTITGRLAARREKSLRVENCSWFRPESPQNEWQKSCHLYDQIRKRSSPTQCFSLDPRQYVCSAVEYMDWEIRELDCRMRAERKRWASRQNYEKVRLTQELPLPAGVSRKSKCLWNIGVKIAADVSFCAADQRRCDSLSW